jgi:hypothetical protein
MYDVHRELIETLAATPETLAGLLRGVSDAQARSAVGGDEGWSVIEVICHLRDAERIGIERMAAMRDQVNPQIIGFDQDALAREKKYAEADPSTGSGQALALALADFTRMRAEYVAALAALTPEQWERPGHHNEIGAITIVAHTTHRTQHDAVHCAQIARQLLNTAH